MEAEGLWKVGGGYVGVDMMPGDGEVRVRKDAVGVDGCRGRVGGKWFLGVTMDQGGEGTEGKG